MLDSIKAYAVIGIEIPLDFLSKEIEVLHSEHDVPEGEMFCSKCGMPRVVRKRDYVIDINEEKFGVFDVVPVHLGPKRGNVYIGLKVKENERMELIDLNGIQVDIIDVRKRLKECLPLNVWSDDAFGLHSVKTLDF